MGSFGSPGGVLLRGHLIGSQLTVAKRYFRHRLLVPVSSMDVVQMDLAN
jgi:hypothetical protein